MEPTPERLVMEFKRQTDQLPTTLADIEGELEFAGFEQHITRQQPDGSVIIEHQVYGADGQLESHTFEHLEAAHG